MRVFHYSKDSLLSLIRLTQLPKAYVPVWANSRLGCCEIMSKKYFVIEEEEILEAMKIAFEQLHLVPGTLRGCCLSSSSSWRAGSSQQASRSSSLWWEYWRGRLQLAHWT